MDSALRHTTTSGVSCAGPRDGLEDSCACLLTQHILRFCETEILPHRTTSNSAIFKSGTPGARSQSESESCSSLPAPERAMPAALPAGPAAAAPRPARPQARSSLPRPRRRPRLPWARSAWSPPWPHLRGETRLSLRDTGDSNRRAPSSRSRPGRDPPQAPHRARNTLGRIALPDAAGRHFPRAAGLPGNVGGDWDAPGGAWRPHGMRGMSGGMAAAGRAPAPLPAVRSRCSAPSVGAVEGHSRLVTAAATV